MSEPKTRPVPPGIELRPFAPEEVPAAKRVSSVAFGEAVDVPVAESTVAGLVLERTLGAFAAGELVGTSAMLDLELTLPGRTQVPAAGLTWVSVLPTHRRRGILRALMERQLTAARDRGDVVSCLLASESHLYGRFGYGPATFQVEACLDTGRGRFRSPVSVPGRMRMLFDPEPVAMLAPIWDEVRRRQVGAVSRRPEWWAGWLREEAAEPGQLLIVLHESDEGGPDGYAVYRFVPEWHDGLGQGRVVVVDLASPRPEVRVALWRYLLQTDLATEVRALHLPVDDDLRWQLLEPRRLRTVALVDDLWLRPLDVRACLEARTYEGTDRLLFEVTDDLFPGNQGCFALSASEWSGSCRRSDGTPDLSLDVAQFGSVLLGGVAFTRLAEAGLIAELTPGRPPPRRPPVRRAAGALLGHRVLGPDTPDTRPSRARARGGRVRSRIPATPEAGRVRCATGRGLVPRRGWCGRPPRVLRPVPCPARPPRP